MQRTEPTPEERMARLRERAERERLAREAAENILEQKSREIYELNQKLERLVAERTRELNVTLNNISQGIVMLGRGGELRVANPKAAELLELDPSDVAVTLSDVIAENGALRDIAARFECVRPSGRIVEVRCEWLADGGLVFTITDITAIKAREAALQAASAAAEQASEAKSRFLSTMSHEMRTPLNGVIGALELLSELPLNREQTFYVDTAMQAGEALLAQINDVLDFSKLEAGKLELVAEPFSLVQLSRSVLGILDPQARKRGNILSLDVGPGVPETLKGDAARLRQVLLNLAGNAVKFTDGGRIDVSISRIGGPDQQPVLEVVVADTGPGIPAERVGQLFREFSMLDATYSRKASGTGLGLAITKRLVTAMGGTVGLSSEPGVGSRFWFKIALPVVTAALPLEQENVAAKPLARGLTVLLVDDNATNRIIGSRMLQAAGHAVELAIDGYDAVKKAGAGTYDAVLMDISMPGIDGVEATRRIRALGGETVRLPIIALTANALSGDRERFLAAGLDGYLTKPLRRAELERCLAEVRGPTLRAA